MSEFGLSGWGLDTWGTTSELFLESAVALTTHSVLVTLSNLALCLSPLTEGDALNPTTWRIARDDASTVWTINAVQKITDRRFVLYLRTALQSWNRVHTVGSTTLRSSTGAMVTGPYTLNFRGVLPATAVTEPAGPFDLLSTDINAGGLRTTEAGAYARIYGDDVIRKMVLRRITTMPGSYFHIAPNDFGQDLKAKEKIRPSSLLALKSRLEEEIMREPGVVDAKASMTLNGGLLQIQARVQTDSQVFAIGVSAG